VSIAEGKARIAAPYVLLAGMVLAVYLQVASFPFINYDDHPHILNNPAVQEGLTLEGVRWALTTDMDAGWIPVTWLSRMLDVSLFGMNAGGHHLVNVLFHMLNAMLLFHAFRRMTGRLGESWLVAALFAVHPLHVESVAWVTERKDVLAGFFWMLSLLAYARYAERPSASRYAAVALWFALGLMSKPIVVTLPFVLVLLDAWPLRRLRLAGGTDSVDGPPFAPATASRLLLEKAPLLAMSAGASVATVISEVGERAVLTLADLPLPVRIGNAVLSYSLYLGKIAWPARLAVFYPHPGSGISPVAVAASAIFLAAATVLAIRSFRACRWLAVGWFWYLGALVPVIGIVQAGEFAMADRCAYLPSIGIYVILAWGASRLAGRIRHGHPALQAAAVACLLALGSAAYVQAGLWRDTGVLFRHALSVTEGNWIAHLNLGQSESAAGRDEAALAHFREALRICPRYTDAKYAVYSTLSRLGRQAEALRYFADALRDSRSDSRGITRVGLSFAESGKIDEAAACFREAVRRSPDDAEANYNLAVALVRSGKQAEAASHFLLALRIEPADAGANNRLGVALMGLGRHEEAIARFREAVRLDAGHGEARFNLGVALARTGRRREAIDCFRAILRDYPGDSDAGAELARLEGGRGR
jgi:tetratricopeptide (TPR) repeat protein